MILILGLDIATTTDFALYEPGQPLSTIKTGLIKAVTMPRTRPHRSLSKATKRSSGSQQRSCAFPRAENGRRDEMTEAAGLYSQASYCFRDCVR